MNHYQDLIIPGSSKIMMLVMDGLGGLPLEPGGKTELETAHTPNMDALAARSALGMTIPVRPGITAGSGPGHLAIFGYDPLEYVIGRGAMEALGIDFDLLPDDIAARGNFCTVDQDGVLIDRRAGRLPSEISQTLIELLQTIHIEGVQIYIRQVKEHRFAFILRGSGLEAGLTETDPLKIGCPPHDVEGNNPGAQKAAVILNEFIRQAKILLAGKQPANMIMLRGFAKLPVIPSYQELFGLNAAAIAIHGMYRGVARMVGMKVLPVDGNTLDDEVTTLENHWQDHDFFYLHVKKTDTTGEDGDFPGKVRAIEEVDSFLPRILALNPDVIIIGGDHSSPAVMRSHSWHPVPALLYSPNARPDGIPEFGERVCSHGSLGILPATHLMPLAIANAGRLSKFGA